MINGTSSSIASAVIETHLPLCSICSITIFVLNDIELFFVMNSFLVQDLVDCWRYGVIYECQLYIDGIFASLCLTSSFTLYFFSLLHGITFIGRWAHLIIIRPLLLLSFLAHLLWLIRHLLTNSYYIWCHQHKVMISCLNYNGLFGKLHKHYPNS